MLFAKTNNFWKEAKMTKIKIERLVYEDRKTEEYLDEYNIYHKVYFKWVIDEEHLSYKQMLRYIERWLSFAGVKIITTVKEIKGGNND